MYEPSGSAGTVYGGQASEPLAPVLATFAGPAAQRRLTVLFRVILAIPHLLCLAGLGIAAEIVVIIGWFGALFTGQLPDFAADFLGGYLHWQTRVSAYMALMTDEYPPFALGDAPYPVRIAFRPGQLNRLAVLFRMFLVIPASIVAYVLELGAFTILGFVTWLIVLIKGAMPDSLYEAYAAVIRYVARYWGFTLMLTSAYPGGLFGDPLTAAAPASAPPATFAAEPLADNPEPLADNPEPLADNLESRDDAAEPSAAEPPSGGQGPAFGAAEPAFGAAEPAFATAQPNPWSLVLSSQARTLVGVVLVLGVLGVGGIVGGDVALIGSRVATIVQVNDAYHTLRTQLTNEASSANSCGATDVTCATGVMGSVSTSYTTFADSVDGISMPNGAAVSARGAVTQDARKLANDYHQLARVTSVSAFNALANSLSVANDEQTLHTDSGSLAHALGTTISS